MNFETCPHCNRTMCWSAGRLICPNAHCPGAATQQKESAVTLISRACAALARRHVDQHGGIGRTALLHAKSAGDAERGGRGIELAVSRGWLERNGHTLALAAPLGVGVTTPNTQS